MEYRADIDNDELAKLPKAVFDGNIHLVRTPHDLERVLPILQNEHILGFDTETRPSFAKGKINSIALLQLATSRHAVLIKLKEVDVSAELKALLENPHITKVGAAIHDDIKAIQRMSSFEPQRFIDLQTMVPDYGIESLSLRKMVGIVLGQRLSKSQQLSNWELPEYTEAQMQYAALDAWACREIYMKLLLSKTQ